MMRSWIPLAMLFPGHSFEKECLGVSMRSPGKELPVHTEAEWFLLTKDETEKFMKEAEK